MKCEFCGKKSDGYGSGRFCSRSCISKFGGISRTPEVIEKNRQFLIGRKRSEETKKKIGNTIKNTIASWDNEKLEEIKKAHSYPNAKKHKKHNHPGHLDETKEKLSRIRTKLIEEGKSHCNYFDVYNGKKLIKVQGTWEKRIGESLTKFGIYWIRKTIIYQKYKRYTPDFYLPEFDIYIEVKGFMMKRDIEKYHLVVEETNIDLRLIDSLQLITLFETGKINIHDLKTFKEQYGTRLRRKAGRL